MDTGTELDALDRALSRAAARHVTPPLDAAQLRRRRRRLAIGPLVWLLFAAALVVTAVLDRSPWLAGGLAVVLLPGAIGHVLGRRREVASLTDVDDFDVYERRYFAAQAKQQRSAVVIEAAIAVAFAIVAWQMGEAWRWSVPAAFGALAAGRAVAVLPYVERANRDAGGDRPPRWTVLLLQFVLFLLLPLLLVAALGRGLWTRIHGGRGGRA